MIDAEKKPLPKHVDVVVAGGGTAGCAAALHLAIQGRSVVLFERRLCGSQASGANFGGVRQQGRCPEEIPLSFRARGIWDRLPDIVGHDCGFRPTGHIKLARSREEFADLESWAGMARQFGLNVTLMDGKVLRAKHPYLGDIAHGGSLCETDGQANPRIVAPMFARAAEAAGADLREECPVQHLAKENGAFRVEVADGRSLLADVVLNTSGAWGASLAEQLGDGFEEDVLAPNMLVTEPLPRTLTANYGVCGGDVYFRQTARGNVVFGGGRGFADRDTAWSRPSLEASVGITRKTIDLLPFLECAHVIRCWSGLDGYMPDGHGVLGPSPTTPGLFHAFGFSGHGFQLGPGVGEVLCDLVVKGRTDTDISGLSPCRFAS